MKTFKALMTISFAGYDRRLPGFPRYSVLGSDSSGIFSLEISNATLEDDAVFECQVGPSPNNRPIRASARLNVMRKFFSLVYPTQFVANPHFLLQCLQPKLRLKASNPAQDSALEKTKWWNWNASFTTQSPKLWLFGFVRMPNFTVVSCNQIFDPL